MKRAPRRMPVVLTKPSCVSESNCLPSHTPRCRRVLHNLAICREAVFMSLPILYRVAASQFSVARRIGWPVLRWKSKASSIHVVWYSFGASGLVHVSCPQYQTSAGKSICPYSHAVQLRRAGTVGANVLCGASAGGRAIHRWLGNHSCRSSVFGSRSPVLRACLRISSAVGCRGGVGSASIVGLGGGA